jgi:hypothetical protein
MAGSGLDPIGESAIAPSMARSPRLDPIGGPLAGYQALRSLASDSRTASGKASTVWRYAG